ncbi:hypothetical protein BsWGS_25079 [Bradybaena similaris]
MALPAGLNVTFLVGLSLLFIGTLLHIIGQSTPEWMVSKPVTGGSFGLWELCGKGVCVTYPNALKPAELEVCEAFAILGILACLASLGLALVNFVVAILGKPQYKIVPGMVLSSSIVALIFILICVIVWAAKIYNSRFTSLGYSFILSIIGGVLTAFGGVLAYAGTNQNRAY